MYATPLLPSVLWILLMARPHSPRLILYVCMFLRLLWGCLIVSFLAYTALLAILLISVETRIAKVTLVVIMLNWVLMSLCCTGGVVGLQPVFNRGAHRHRGTHAWRRAADARAAADAADARGDGSERAVGAAFERSARRGLVLADSQRPYVRSTSTEQSGGSPTHCPQAGAVIYLLVVRG